MSDTASPDMLSTDRLAAVIQTITSGQIAPQPEMEAAFDTIMEGLASPSQIAAFMVGLKMRGEAVGDITAGAAILRRRAVSITAPDGAMDIVGTGGDSHATYNISTATAFVVAGCGVPVAKHGNKAVSSLSGAADVLSSLGITLDCPMDQVEAALSKAGICFLMAPRHHAAMRHVGPIRAELKIRTIFNLLGPLSNPAFVKHILVGVYDAGWCRPFAEALHALGTDSAWVVHGADGLDELSTTGTNQITALKDGQITQFELSPADFGLAPASLADIKGGTPAQNAEALRAVLNGAEGAYRDIVLMNAAGALMAAGRADDLTQAMAMARSSIDSGAATGALDALIAATG